MKFKITLIIIFFSIANSYSCSCNPKPDFKYQDDLKEYDFIAHVKITNIKGLENKDSDFLTHTMSFNILELYKGNELKNINIF